MVNFIEWFGRNRKVIGYTVGILNVSAGVNALMFGNISGGVVGIMLGTAVLIHTKEFK